MKYFSTFSGIGGFELGIIKAYEICNANRSENRGSQEDTQRNQGQGLQSTPGQEASTEERPASKCNNDITNQRPLCVGYSEIDKYAQQIYQAHFPNHKKYGDITAINEKELPDFDLLVGGFPCQSFSIAGKRGGFRDTRGTMFFEIARIIREKQPRLLLLENVKGLLSHDKGNTFTTIISTLDELGYDCQWQVLNSKNHGVPQNRERVFIIGHLRGTSRPQVFPFGESDSLNNGKAPQGNDLAYCLQAGNDKHRGSYVRQTKDGFHLARNDKKKSSIQGTHVTFPTGKSHALSTGHKPMTLEDLQIRRLTPTECERLQGFPDGWTKKGVEYLRANGDTNGLSDLYNEIEISDTQRYKTLGNAVTVNVIRDIFDKIL